MRSIIFLLIFSTTFLFSQNRTCGSNKRLDLYLSENPLTIYKQKRLEKQIKESNLEQNILSNLSIPVVVHVVYKNSIENITDYQIQSQIDVLSKDFTRANSDALNTPTDFLPIASSMQIDFCLSQQDPNGNPTNGIIRKQTSQSFFPLYGNEIFYDSLGGSSAWDTKNYLNIWVCMIEPGILGWAQFPAGGDIKTDGVVINFEHFGTTGTALSPYNLGRTATHEVGHWLNLFHLWGDNNCGDDLVNDTPTQEEENFGCKIHPSISCNNNGDMFMNFMDYTNDNCMNSFTEGQKSRVWSSITNFRSELFLSNGCSSSITANSDAGISSIISPNNSTLECTSPVTPIVVLTNYGNTNLNTVTIKYSLNSGNNLYYSWNGLLLTNDSDTIALPSITASGTSHFITVSAQMPNNSTDINASNDEFTETFNSIDGEKIKINIKTDNYANETSWQLVSENNDVILTGDSLENNILYEKEICLSSGCYKFIINDSYGDGFCCDFGNGFYQIYNSANNSSLASNSYFQFTDTSFFCIGMSGIDDLSEDFQIFPNPTCNEIMINNTQEKVLLINIIDNLGNTVLSKKIKNEKLNISHLKNGIYHLIIKTEHKEIIKKLVIQK